jgi:NAD(P)H-hydrate epimerase
MRKLTFGSRELNQLLDQALMEKHGFPSETLMELAGLAAAQVADRLLTVRRDPSSTAPQTICVLVGPGNNGGDGLVAARHLQMMKYAVDLVVFKQLEGKNGNYLSLCRLNGIPSKTPEDFQEDPTLFGKHLQDKSLIVDAIFGFPFRGEIRQPYRDYIQALRPFEGRILSVDIPSGWDANEGNIHQTFTPAFLISLGLPKQCSEGFKGEHYFGGRFVPECLCKELEVVLPEFEGAALYCRL